MASEHYNSMPSTPGFDIASPMSLSPPGSPETASSLRAKSRADMEQKGVYGLKLGLLRQWENEKREQLLGSEHALQEIAVSKVRGFLDAIGCVVKIQSWTRMLKPFHAHLAYKRAQRETKRIYYRAMRLFWKSERLYRVQVFGKFFIGWREEARTSKNLKILITQFFRICIQRLRLTPQACMAFFNPGEWSSAIAKSDMLKIRRLMLEKLFFGWRTETRELRMMRYKASQILSRMVRRTKGQLWVKEATLVCFHMWYRYIQVKRAYRMDLPDPRFTNPMLPQWTKLQKEITIHRIKRKRTGELATYLTRMRSFKNWKRLMSVDRTKPVTPLAVAIIHYSTVLVSKVLRAWHDIIRERGRMMRFRTKLFYTWRQWAPKHRQMRHFNDQAEELIRLRRVQRAYGVMIKLCFNVIGTRTERIKELRRNFCDRRVVICAYALLHKDSHMMMVDCWRRLYFYWKSRRNWKSVAWHFAYEWHSHKMKVIFAAWKSLTQQPAPLPPSYSVSPAVMLARSAKHLSHVTERDEDNSWQSTPYGVLSRADSVDSACTMNSDEHNTNRPAGSPSKSPSKAQVLTAAAAAATIAANAGEDHPQPPPATPGGTVTSAAPSEAGSRPTSAGSTQSSTAPRRRQSSFRGKVTFNNPYSSTKLGASVKVPNYEKLVRDFVPKGLSIVQKGVEGKLPTKLTALQFRTFCFALSRSYAQLATRLHTSVYGKNSSSCRSRTVSGAATATATLASLDEASLPVASDDAAAGSGLFGHRPLPHFLSSTDVLHSESTAAVLTSSSAALERTDYEVSGFQELHFPVQKYYNRALQERLQTAIDEVDVEEVLRAVTEGAVIETSHIRQLGVHIGDMYMPLFTLLLTNSTQFFVDRVVKQDAQQLLLEMQNPINAFLAGSQIERWLRAEVSYREMMQVTQDMPTQRYISGEFSSYYLMRFIILKNIDMKAKRLLHLCVMLPESRTVDEEVPEVLKRQKLAKLYSLRKSLTEMVGDDDSFQETYLAAMSAIPPLVQPPPRQAATPYAQVQDTAGKDIYTVLREFTLLTGKLTKEAKSVRAPLMERDQRLIDNGFLRQARADFLALRQECLTDKQRAEIAVKQKKAEEKERKALEKLKKAERRKKEKRLGSPKRKGKKGGRASVGVASLDFGSLDNQALTSDDEGYNSENGGEGTHLSDLCKLSFLEGGLEHIGEESDLQHDQDFQSRAAHFKRPMFLEVFRRYGWREKPEVRGAIERGMVASMRGTLRRVMAVLQADKTIGKMDLATACSRHKGIGQHLVNHALAHVACRRSATWYVLPKEYWSFRTVRERVHLELAVTDATMTAIKSRLSANHSATHTISSEIAMFQKFLKQTRKDFMKIAEKRTHKAEADVEERAPFLARMKKCDIRTKGAQQAIVSIKEKLRRAEVQVATGNLNGAAEVFIPPEDPPVVSSKKDAKKNGKTDSTKDEAPAVVYDYKAVHALMEAATQEIQRLEDSVVEQAAARQQCEKEMRMFDWQCQRTSRMLRDLAEGRFQMMIDVQQVAVREAKRLGSTEDTAEVQTMRYKSMRRYYHSLMAFLEGPITERGQQLAREAEQRRVSEVLKGSPSGRTDFSSPMAAQAAAQVVASKKRGALAGSEEVDSFSFRSQQLDSRTSSEADLFLDRGASAGGTLTDGFGAEIIEEDDRSAVDSIFSDGDSTQVLEERRRHEAEKAAALEALLGTDELEPTDTRTSSQIAVDQEIELAHHNSLENRLKREAALQLLAEEQARELATQDLRLRVFEDYWNALPQNAERVLRKKATDIQDDQENNGEDTAATVAEIKSSYLNRSDRMWKAIGASYWREKEETVRAMLVKGEDVSEARQRMVREVDPLDEDLNEMAKVQAPKIQFADDVNDSRPDTTGQRLQQLSAFEDVPGLWKATTHADHVKMMSVSMKELNSDHTERRDSQASESQAAGDDSSVGSGSNQSPMPNRKALYAGGAPAPMSRQGSSVVGSRQVSRQASRQGALISRNNSDQSLSARGGGGGGARGAANPDPFSLVGRDEYFRFVDHSHPQQPTSNDVPLSEDADMLRLELGHLTNPHMPTLQEGGTDAEAGELATLEEDSVAADVSSPSSKSPMQQIRKDAKALLKMMGFSTRSLKTTSTRTSTFEDFDRVFDKMTDSIVGALEKTHSQKIDPALIVQIMKEDEGSEDCTPEETPEGSLKEEPQLPSAIIENANRNSSSCNTSRRRSFGSTQSAGSRTPTAGKDKSVKFDDSFSKASSRRPSLTSPTELATAAKSPSPSKRSSFSGAPLSPSDSSRPSSSLSTPHSSDKRHTIVVNGTTGKHLHPDSAIHTKTARRASFDGRKNATVPAFTDSIATVTATAAAVEEIQTPATVSSEPLAGAGAVNECTVPSDVRPALTETVSSAADVEETNTRTDATVDSEGLVGPTTLRGDGVSVIPEGSVECSQMSRSSAATPPPALELPPQQQRRQHSRSPSKILFSDELITSSRDAADEDDVHSEISAQVFVDERGNAVLYGTDGMPITRQHPEYERMRLQQKLLGHIDSPSLSRLSTPQGSALPSARSAVHSVQSSRLSGSAARSQRGDAFDESATSVTKALMQNISTMSVEPQPSYSGSGSPGPSARYLPERELREAIFGGELDTGAAGLESLLQSFASNQIDSSYTTARKARRKVEEDQGYVAVSVSGEWVLQRSTASPPRPYSPKIQLFSPGHASTAASRNGFGTVSSPPLRLTAPQPQAPEPFLMEGISLCAKASEEVPRKPSVLSPPDNMRLAEKLGLDMQPQEALRQDTTAHEPTVDVDTEPVEVQVAPEVNQDLLSLVQEFYDDKAAEEERLEHLKKRATTSYFPPNFRQSRDLFQSSDAVSQGEFQHLLDTDWFGDDDMSEASSVNSPMRQLLLQGEGDVGVPILRKHSNSMVGASFARGSFNAFTPEMSGKFSRRNSTKILQELPQFTNNEILAAVAAVVGTVNANRGTQPQLLKAPSGDSAAEGAPELVVGAPVRRLSTRMEQMLSRRGSFNPAEVRLELLDSIHDTEASQLEQELDSAVKEVRKYLQDRETERHRETPKGRLRNKESFARSYREAVQQRGNPHKMLSIQRSAQIQAGQQALLLKQTQRRPSPPASPLVSTLFAPDDAVHLQRNVQVQGQGLGDVVPLVSDRRDSLSSQESVGQLEHPSRSQSAAVQYAPGRVHFSGLGSQDTARDATMRDPAEYVTKRAGTPDFWVDVTKLSPTASAHFHPPAGQNVASQQKAMEQELSIVGGDAEEGSQLSEGEAEGQQVLMLDVASGVDYQHTSVLGFSKENSAILAASHSLQQTGGSRGGAPPPQNLNLQVTAVKLDHPVSAQPDPKTEGQYHLYRERSPLRSSRRSPSPPTNSIGRQGYSGNHHAGGAGGRKQMVYSHSDGILSGVNAVITGTKAKLNATTDKFSGHNHVEDGLDERSAGGDTFNSSLSHMTFNLVPRPASPPLPKSAPQGLNLGSPSGGQSSRRLGSSPGGTPHTPTRADLHVAGAEEGEQQGLLRRSRSSSSRSPSHHAHSEAVGSDPNSRPSTPAVLAAAALAADKLGLAGMSGSINAESSAPDRSSSSGPGTARGGSRSHRDYWTSASASKIISEIAGEPYFSGWGPGQVTTSSSTAGTVTAGGSIVSVEAGLSVPHIEPQRPAVQSNMHLPTDGTLSFSVLSGRPSSSSPSTKRALGVTSYVFSPDSVGGTSEGFLPAAGTSYISAPGSRSRSPSPPPPQLSAGASRAPTPLHIAFPSDSSLRSSLGPSDPVPSITATPKLSAKEASVPSNVVTAESRKVQQAALHSADFLVVLQSLSSLALINDRSQKFSRNPSTSFTAAKSAKIKSSKVSVASAAAAVRRSASAADLLPLEIAGTDLDSLPSFAEDAKMPVPVKKVEVSKQSPSAAVADTRPSAGQLLEINGATVVQEEGERMTAGLRAVEGDAQAQALMEEQMEVDIELELRQMLSEQHQEEAREAYRAAYYHQNKSFLANAGVAVQKREAHKGFVPSAVPFVAGSSSHPTPNTTVSARVAGLSSAERIRMSSSVGGGGFSRRGHGVLHKVKGSQQQHSASTTMLPPLDPSIMFDAELSAVPASPGGKRRQKTRSRRDGDRETHNIDSILAASPDTLVHNKLKLAALLHTATGTADPEQAQSTQQVSDAGQATATQTRHAPRGLTRASMADVAIAVTAGMKSNTATAQLGEQDMLLYGNKNNNSSTATGGPGKQRLSQPRLLRDNSMDSLNSLGSSSNGPLQAIYAPAVEVTHNSSTPHSAKARSGRSARFS